jgi:molybdopterin molybdotransferase
VRLLEVDEAQQRVLSAASPLPPRVVPIEVALGRVLATPLRARWPLPQLDVSVMDGYAVRSVDLVGRGALVRLRRVAHSAAGRPHDGPVGPGEAIRISTGAVVPADCDVVIPQEDTRVEGDHVDIDLAATGAMVPGAWIRPAGSDVPAGAEILPAGVRLGAPDLAAAAAAGHARVSVHRRPTVAVVSTGDELVPIGDTPEPGRIVGTNEMMLAALVREAGGIVHAMGAVPDDPVPLAAALRDALGLADVVVTLGGASVGDHDLVAEAWRDLGCSFAFHGVALRPGKPTGYGRVGDRHVFVLPGNPASVLVGFELFVRPALRRLLGVRGDVRAPTLDVVLRNEARGAGPRTHFVRARLHPDGTATVLADQTSGNLRSITDFDALVVVPPHAGSISARGTARALVVDPWWMERRSSSS